MIQILICYDLFRATVAVVTDDPEHKNKLKQSLSAVFNGKARFYNSLLHVKVMKKVNSILYFFAITSRPLHKIVKEIK